VDDNPVVTISPAGMIEECKGIAVIFTTDPGTNLNFQWNKNGNAITGANENSFTTNKSENGGYTVKVNGENGCIATSQVTELDRLALPAASIVAPGGLDLCATGSVNLKANSGIGFSYQWYRNAQLIAGATSQLYHALVTGNYKVVVTNSNGCSKTSMKVIVFTTCKLSGDESVLDHSIIAYPNPFSNTTHIDLSRFKGPTGFLSEDKVEIRITDLSGKILFQKTFSYQDVIEIGDELQQGFYLVEVKGENHQQVIPIVKE
jgi:hypothetical protein